MFVANLSTLFTCMFESQRINRFYLKLGPRSEQDIQIFFQKFLLHFQCFKFQMNFRIS